MLRLILHLLCLMHSSSSWWWSSSHRFHHQVISKRLLGIVLWNLEWGKSRRESLEFLTPCSHEKQSHDAHQKDIISSHKNHLSLSLFSGLPQLLLNLFKTNIIRPHTVQWSPPNHDYLVRLLFVSRGSNGEGRGQCPRLCIKRERNWREEDEKVFSVGKREEEWSWWAKRGDNDRGPPHHKFFFSCRVACRVFPLMVDEAVIEKSQEIQTGKHERGISVCVTLCPPHHHLSPSWSSTSGWYFNQESDNCGDYWDDHFF